MSRFVVLTSLHFRRLGSRYLIYESMEALVCYPGVACRLGHGRVLRKHFHLRTKPILPGRAADERWDAIERTSADEPTHRPANLVELYPR